MTTIDSSTISDNFSIGFGGAFASFSHEGSAIITITNSTISNNTAHYYGGAIEAEDGSYLTLINTTVSGNSASVAGGINVYRANSFTARNSTIAFNHASNTGGLFLGAPTTIDSTIVAKNYSADQRHAADVASYNVVVVAGSNNLVTSNDAKVDFDSTTLRSDPLLQPLAENGGPTLTHALGIGSPAIDAGDNAVGLKWDQRGYGFPRGVGYKPDIGAFERLDDRIFFDGFEGL
jgi:parallel beta-helix repeat protein